MLLVLLSMAIMHCHLEYLFLHYAAKSALFIQSSLPLLLMYCILESFTVEYYL